MARPVLLRKILWDFPAGCLLGLVRDETRHISYKNVVANGKK